MITEFKATKEKLFVTRNAVIRRIPVDEQGNCRLFRVMLFPVRPSQFGSVRQAIAETAYPHLYYLNEDDCVLYIVV